MNLFSLVAFLFFLPVLVHANVGSVVINEIAWSGTKASSYGEWVELYNPEAMEVVVNGWALWSGTTTPEKMIDLSGTIRKQLLLFQESQRRTLPQQESG